MCVEELCIYFTAKHVTESIYAQFKTWSDHGWIL